MAGQRGHKRGRCNWRDGCDESTGQNFYCGPHQRLRRQEARAEYNARESANVAKTRYHRSPHGKMVYGAWYERNRERRLAQMHERWLRRGPKVSIRPCKNQPCPYTVTWIGRSNPDFCDSCIGALYPKRYRLRREARRKAA